MEAFFRWSLGVIDEEVGFLRMKKGSQNLTALTCKFTEYR